MTIQLEHVSKRYGRHVALDNISLTFSAGRIVGLLGPNGAGKTTLLRIAAGLVRPSQGAVVSNTRAGISARRYFGGEHTLPPDLSARDWLRLWGGKPTLDAPPRHFGVLSRGTRQRIGLEATLASAEACLLLDEPWEGLDPDASRWLSTTLYQRRDGGNAIVVSSHRIHDLAAVCDQCLFLVSGRLIPGSVDADPGHSHAERVARLLDAFDRARERH